MDPRCDARRPVSARARARALVVLVVVLLAAVVASAGPAQAQDGTAGDPGTATGPPTAEDAEAARALEETLALAPEDVPPSPDDVFVAVVEARAARDEADLALLAGAQRSADADREALLAAQALERARAAEARAVDVRDARRATLTSERDLLSDLTVRAYVTGGDLSVEEYRAIIDGDTTDPDRGRTIMFEQVLIRQEAVAEAAGVALARAQKTLVRTRSATAAARRESGTRALAAATRARERVDAERAAVEARTDLQQATDRLRSGQVGGMVPEGVALIGLPRLSAEDLAGWFAASAYQPRVATPIADYAAWFIAEGASEGIRGDIAFAQAVLETGGFANEDSVRANNFSGIGHCDSCPSGWTFPTPELGVRAQIQLLKSYAVRKPAYVHPLVDKRLRGPAGCCPTWGDLTTVWATDPGYGPKVMMIYTSIVSHALARRAAGEGLADQAPT